VECILEIATWCLKMTKEVAREDAEMDGLRLMLSTVTPFS